MGPPPSGDAPARKLVPLKVIAVYSSSPEGPNRNPGFIPLAWAKG